MSKEVTLAELGEMLTHVVEHMATKEDINSLRGEFESFRDETRENFRDLRADLEAIRRELQELRSKVKNVEGYRKEIDHALDRIVAIERHLGIENKTAA